MFDNNYFNDKYQGIPVGGYNVLIERLLDGVETRLECDFFAHRDELTAQAEQIVFTGAIDEFYQYRFGKLEYRTVHFETEVKDCSNYQGNAVVNYTEREVPYTRVIEHKHFEMFGAEVDNCPRTVISREYSSEWQEGSEPYYPVNDERNNALYQKYKVLADEEKMSSSEGALPSINIMTCTTLWKSTEPFPFLTGGIQLTFPFTPDDISRIIRSDCF